MAICKFNVGDMVERINHNNDNYGYVNNTFRVGQVGKVVKIHEDGFVDVEVGGQVNCDNDPVNLKLVKATPKFKVGDRVIVEECNIENMVHLRGKDVVGTIVRDDGHHEHPYWVVMDEHPTGLYCSVKCLAPKFKVGDKVIGNHPNRYGITKKGWKGVVKEVRSDGNIDVMGQGNVNHNQMFHNLELQYFDLVKTEEKTEEKIVITHDGKTTTATKYCEDGSKVTATARCAPEDDFDFRVGAEIAMARLVDKLVFAKHNVIRVVFREGEQAYSYKTRMDTAKVGMKIVVPVGNRGKEVNATVVEIIPGATYNGEYAMSAMKEIDIVEVIEYFNGKVVCINNDHVTSDLTVGKIYTFVDGQCKNDLGCQITISKVKDANDLNSRFRTVKFIEIIEDKNDPLTLAELKKMDGQKVYVICLDENCKETPDHLFCGWHTVNVKSERLIDENDQYYNFTAINEEYGYHAYRTAPSK